MPPFDMIAFDADDTLWDNERYYIAAQAKLASLLAPYAGAEAATERLHQVEIENLPLYGYGIKGFALSMIEASLRISKGRIPGQALQPLLDHIKEMLGAPVRLIAGVPEVLEALARHYPLALITKGDLFEQEAKIQRSGLGSFFQAVEIVSQKTPASYAGILTRHGISPERFLMVGNALRSDILPVLALGGHAVYVPHENTWSHETTETPPQEQPGFYQLAHIGELPVLLAGIAAD